MLLLARAGIDPLLVTGLVLLAVLGGLAWLQRHLGGGGGPSRRAETVALTRDHAVHVVELGGRRLLVGTGPSGAPRVLAELPELERIHELAAEGEQARANPAAAGWRALLDRIGGRGG
jgi:hypothetical protein